MSYHETRQAASSACLTAYAGRERRTNSSVAVLDLFHFTLSSPHSLFLLCVSIIKVLDRAEVSAWTFCIISRDAYISIWSNAHEELHKLYKEDLRDRDAGGMIGAGWGSQGWAKDDNQTEQYNNVKLLQTGSVKEAMCQMNCMSYYSH